MMRFIVLGAGGIGTALGVLLGAAGFPVTFVVEDEEIADRIRQDGASVYGVVDATTHPLVLAGGVELGPEDVLILAVKAHQTEAALASSSGSPAAVLSVQNGIEKELPLIKKFGRDRVVASVVQVTATLDKAGRSRCAGIDPSAVSPLSVSLAPTTAGIANALTTSGIKTTIVDDALAIEWGKAAQWLPSSLLTAATGLSLDVALREPDLARAYVVMARECAAVAQAHGIAIADFPKLYAYKIITGELSSAAATLTRLGEEMAASGLAGYRTSMELDLARGRSLELDATAGAVLRAAGAVDLPCPSLDAVHAIVRVRAGRTGSRAQ